MEYIILGSLLLLSGFFSSAETAFFSLRHSQVLMMYEQRRKNAHLIYTLRSHPQRLLITILVGNNIVNLFAASYATYLAIAWFGSLGVGIATGGVTLLVLVFGEIVPKSVAYSHNMQVARIQAKPIYVCYYALYPITWILLKFNRVLNYLLRLSPQRGVTEEEIKIMARLGAESGAIDHKEHEMIKSVFRFDDVTAGEIMTPRSHAEFLNGDVPVDQIAHFISMSGYSRFPVYEKGDQQKIVGYVHINQIMRALNSNERSKPVAAFCSPLKRVSEAEPIDRVFREMKDDKAHMYLVHAQRDTQSVIGLVTLEDILEQVVGDIEDETDAVYG